LAPFDAYPDLEVHRSADARRLVVTFGSFHNEGRVAPAYAFMKTVLAIRQAGEVRFDAAYVLAHRNDWYFSGAKHLGDTFDDTLRSLRTILASYDGALFLGNSMGAYAALAFGLLAPADRVLAFSPQTRFDAEFCSRIGEHRWSAARAAMQHNHAVSDFAVTALASRPGCPHPVSNVYVGARQAEDVAYAQELDGIEGLVVHRMDHFDHDLVHTLRASGDLERIVLEEALILARTTERTPRHTSSTP